MKKTVEACFYVLNEEEGLGAAIRSALDAGVDSILVWDTGSTDRTCDVANSYTKHIYRLRVPEEAVHFGEMETMVCHLSGCDWVLRLDGDETIEMAQGMDIHDLIDDYYGVWRMPRYRWADLDRTLQLEVGAFPDFQYRFFMNNRANHYVGPLHPRFETPYPIGDASDVAVLHHFVDPLHLSDPERLARRKRLYERLAVQAGKAPEGSAEGMRLAGHGLG